MEPGALVSVATGTRPGQDVARGIIGLGVTTLMFDGRSLAMVMLLNLIRFTFFTNAATEAGVL